jgi:GTP diphosphokinase / guanosine-3',5'-bis(diphosphate) 3'-diphosphatase
MSVSAHSADHSELIEDILMRELRETLTRHGASDADVALVDAAFLFARAHHEGQKRKNGENYIMHPVSVALILADMWADIPTLQAALMHDVLEDTQATAEEMTKRFGPEVTGLVQGVTKLGKYKYAFSTKEEEQAENFRNMFLAMAKDIRILTLKLADRLHNMRTLEHMLPHKQQKIARETLEVFAPLANRIGMGNFRAELEDLAIRYLEPDAFMDIRAQLQDSQPEREEGIARITSDLHEAIRKHGIEPRIYSRLKNYYSIYKKMASQQKEIRQIFDISALRVIVETEAQCYEVLGIIHNRYTPVAGRFKDYIAMPKSNFYQSLHTTIISPNRRPIEVQIRTRRMHEVAEHGIAAHFNYKTFGDNAPAYIPTANDASLAWLKQLVEMQQESNNALEFVENVKLDLFPDQVFVFTPKGSVISLPRGATPVDFAFRIHTEIGNTCAGAIVNEKMVPLNTELQNGDIIEIIRNKKASPRLDWVNFVVTQQAKNRIRQWYKKHYRDMHETQGRQMLEADLGRTTVDALVKSGRMADVARELNYTSIEEMYVGLGYGETTMARIINRVKKGKMNPGTTETQQATHELLKTGSTPKTLDQTLKDQQLATRSSVKEFEAAVEKASRAMGDALSQPDVQPDTWGTASLKALKGLQYNIARCCMPVPGDGIVGVVTRSRGVMIHRNDCLNVIQANPQRVMELSWNGAIEMQQSHHNVLLEMQVMDQVGALTMITGKVAEMNVNIFSASSRRLSDGRTAQIELGIEVRNLEELERLIRNIKLLPDIIAVKRSRYRMNK